MKITNPAWRRLVRAFRPHVSRSQIAGAVLLALLGFAAAVQVRALRTDSGYPGTASRTELIQVLDGLQQKSRSLESEISEAEQVRARLTSDKDKTSTAIEQADERAVTLGILAGTLPAAGPGIKLTISGSGDAIYAALILNTIEELRDAGAEAIEINDQVRVVASSYMLDGQGGIVVDQSLIPPPYTIEAIGDPRTLATAMRIPGGVVDSVDDKGGHVQVSELDDTAINTVHRPRPPRFAKPAPDGEGGD
ncbi:DUF881 domain-containing protein [Tenggerimyces flavus]|uniref:DUF881 domain-containing protein n=1 Tax=Tenggerimyces flavus TaxID=1708749 RepID=A0ABV7YGC5_9ACTN|nr:DUF881 domain-containing protein [Tenggerimyces flavus]MBM7788037.1 uncharacterized protein YlxW (UPF0749 family) [Tenggerimyces flavus]